MVESKLKIACFSLYNKIVFDIIVMEKNKFEVMER